MGVKGKEAACLYLFPCSITVIIMAKIMQDLTDNASLEKIFSKCPALEDLTIEGRLFDEDVYDFRISAPKLESLVLGVQGDAGLPNYVLFLVTKAKIYLKIEDSNQDHCIDRATALSAQVSGACLCCVTSKDISISDFMGYDDEFEVFVGEDHLHY